MKKLNLLLVITILFLSSFTGCMPNNTTEAINGLYSNTKGDVFCIVYNDTITVSKKTDANAVTASDIVSHTFKFALENGSYNGKNEEKIISFKLNGDKLNLKLDGKTYYLTLDKSFSFNDKTVEINKPSNINDEASQIFWHWSMNEFSHPYENGILSACLEITSKENELIKREHINYIPEPASMFSYDLKNMKLTPGKYNLLVKYVGGMYIKNGTIYQSLDSETVTFSLTVTENDEYIIREVNGGENNPDMNSSKTKWENDVALYVDIYFEDSYPTSEDIEKTFENYKYTRMFLVNKSIENNSITLLFIFDSVADKETFSSQVKADSIVAYTRNCYDIPYESIDTRYIECEKDVIEIGESTTLEIKGTKNYYVQPFDFNGFLVLPQKSSQSTEYNVSDFPQIDLQEIEKLENGWLYFHLNSSDYYSLINSIDSISRSDMFEKVEFDKREITMIPPSIWEFSDHTIVEVVEFDYSSGKIIVKGISAGEVLISFEGIVYKLTVISHNHYNTDY